MSDGLGRKRSEDPPPSPSPPTTNSDRNDIKLAMRLYDVGFNVVPVDINKKPLCSWSPNKRIDKDALERLLPKASGIAIVGGSENPFKPAAILVIVDVDAPSALDKAPTLKSLIERTVSWYTGPRCPRCEDKHLEVLEPGRRFKCPKCGLEFTLNEAKRGIGALFTIDLDTYEKYLKGSKRFGAIEFLVNNYQLIPPSIHPSGVRYEWINRMELSNSNYGIYPLLEAEFRGVLEELGLLEGPKEIKEVREGRAGFNELKELSDGVLLRIKELLNDAYKRGVRQNFALYLSGFLAKERVSPISAVKLIKMFYDENEDSDPLKMRLSTVIYSYKKAGIDVDQFANEIERLTGVRPYGLEREISEGDVKGVSGLREILKEIYGEEKALVIIKELEELLQTAGPNGDSIIELVDSERKIYAIVNLRKLVIDRARLVEDKLIYKERVAVVAPTKVIVYDNPIGGIRKFQVTFEGATLRRPLVIGPALIEEIADRLRAEGLVYHSRLINDVLNAVIGAYIKYGRAEVKAEIESPGFYEVDGRIIAVGYEVSEPNKGRLREALELLNELANVWFKHAQDKFATIIKWFTIAPFNYVMKQKGRFLRGIYLYGDSATGKTTLGRIGLRMWGLDSRFEKTGASIDTPARFGYIVSNSTFPVLINEPGNALTKEDIIEMLKNEVDGAIVRGKYVRGTYVEYPALAPLVFTSNKHIPRDDALLRRMYVITFSYGEKIPLDKQKEFKERVESRLQLLSEIGKCISRLVVKEPRLLESDALEVGRILLTKCYEIADLPIPQWINLRYEEETDISSDIVVEFRERLKKYINDTFARYVSRIIEVKENEKSIGLEILTETIRPDEADLEKKLKTLLEKNALVGIKLKFDDDVLINKNLLKEIGLEGVINLKSLAEMLGWEYSGVTERVGKNVVHYKAIKINLSEFISFITK